MTAPLRVLSLYEGFFAGGARVLVLAGPDAAVDTFRGALPDAGGRLRRLLPRTPVEVTLDGAGENITNEQEDGAADQDDLDELGRAAISLKEAVESAFDEVSSRGGGTVLLDDVSLGDDNDALNWEVELDIDDNGAAYYVNANSGSVSSNN